VTIEYSEAVSNNMCVIKLQVLLKKKINTVITTATTDTDTTTTTTNTTNTIIDTNVMHYENFDFDFYRTVCEFCTLEQS